MNNFFGNNSYILLVFTHFILISIVCLIIFFKNKISTYLKIIDYPDNNLKIHQIPTPRLGGLILFFYTLPALLLNYQINTGGLKELIISLILFVVFFTVGLIDDRKLLSARYKSLVLLMILLLTIPLTNVLIVNTINFKNYDFYINLQQAAIFFTIFSIFALYNAYNFSDGVNCVASSLGIFWIIFVIIKSEDYLNIYYQAILISLIIIFYLNYTKKIFLGNSGSSIYSLIISLILIQEYKKNNIFCDEILFILFLPGTDMARISIQRIISGNSAFLGDNNHLHHLMRLVITEKFIFLAYILISIAPILIYNFLIKNFYLTFIFSIAIYFLIYFYLTNIKNILEKK
jgi:UDP-GlcNAc:undecaprenyl-phosphate GlcNAc-1-phosphate transferase